MAKVEPFQMPGEGVTYSFLYRKAHPKGVRTFGAVQ